MKTRTKLALGAAGVAAALGISSVSFASSTPVHNSVPDSNGTFHGCQVIATGILRLIDPSQGQACLPILETPVSWQSAQPFTPHTVTFTPDPTGSAMANPVSYTCPTGYMLSAQGNSYILGAPNHPTYPFTLASFTSDGSGHTNGATWTAPGQAGPNYAVYTYQLVCEG